MEKITVLELEFETLKAIIDGSVGEVNANYNNNRLNTRIAVEFNIKPKVTFLTASKSMMATLTILTGEADETNSVNREDMKELHEYAIAVDSSNHEAVLTAQVMMSRRFLQEAITSYTILARASNKSKPADA